MLITNPQEMIDFWSKIAKTKNNILLYWELGAWKTLFTKWFAKELWINQQEVQSPTYTYIKIYDNKLLHIDLYRVEEFQELVDKWITELIHDYDYVVIERPKFEKELWIEDRKKIRIKKTWEWKREII